MADFRHKRNGVIIDSPRDFQELKISKNFIDKNDDVNINVTTLNFTGEEAKKIKERVLGGLSGGVGVFEGDRYEIEVMDNGSVGFSFKGYLDYSNGVDFIGCNEVSVSLKKEQGRDWLNDVADGFSFRYLVGTGEISSADYIKVPYIINHIPDNAELLMLSITVFMLTKELIESIRYAAEIIADVTDAATPVVGFGVGLGAVAVVAYDIGNVLLIVIKSIAYIAYTIAIIIALKKLIEQIIEQIMPEKRYHLGMSLYDLFLNGCNHLNLSLNSTLLSGKKDWIVVPSKDHRGGEKPKDYSGVWIESGVPNQNDGMDTFGDLIRVWMEGLNADYRIENGVFYFERKDFWDNSGTYVIDDNFVDQKNLKDEFSLNVNEVIGNYNINWQYDRQDLNTLDNQEGRVFQAITYPSTVGNSKYVSIKNLQEIQLPCSLGKQKSDLTKVEKSVKKIAKLVDKLNGIFGGGTGYEQEIDNRKDTLFLSSHFLTKPKMVIVRSGKVVANQRGILSARKLWDDNHHINSFIEIGGTHNQYYRFRGVKVKFCLKDFVDLLDNNNCKTKSGESAKIEKLDWKVWEGNAIIDFRIKRKYTDNLLIKYIE